MNLVYQHPSGGAIYQGDRLDAENFPVLDAARIRVVVLAAANNQPKLPERFDVIRVKILDNFYPTEDEAIRFWDIADLASQHLVDYLTRGESVLSTCWAGLNRSGLMTAFTLMKLGMSDEHAVRRIRMARRGALSNPAFVTIIRSYNAFRRRKGLM